MSVLKNRYYGFANQVLAEHETDAVNLLFNNAGIGGGASIINSPRETWERTFDVCWGGVYWAYVPSWTHSSQATRQLS